MIPLIYLHKGGTRSISTAEKVADAKGEVSSTYGHNKSHSIGPPESQNLEWQCQWSLVTTESSDKRSVACRAEFCIVLYLREVASKLFFNIPIIYATCSKKKKPRISSSRVLTPKIQVSCSLFAASSRLAPATSSFSTTVIFGAGSWLM